MSLEDNGSADAGNPADSNAAAATNGSTGSGASTDLWSGLSEDNRKTVEAKSWTSKTLDDVIGSYRELESRLGRSLTPPGEDAKPEDWDAFYSKLGRPEKPEGYEFKLPDGLPEAFPYDDTSAAKFRNWAHQAGLNPKQAQALHDEFVRDTAASMGALAENDTAEADKAHQALVKAWGDPSSENYKREVELANRAIRNGGGDELVQELKGKGILAGDGSVKAPKLAMLLAKVGRELYAEDSLYAGVGGASNPFSAKSENLTEQGQIIRNDPNRARALIRNAGHDPKEWGL